jgi:hypothetical protein
LFAGDLPRRTPMELSRSGNARGKLVLKIS